MMSVCPRWGLVRRLLLVMRAPVGCASLIAACADPDTSTRRDAAVALPTSVAGSTTDASTGDAGAPTGRDGSPSTAAGDDARDATVTTTVAGAAPALAPAVVVIPPTSWACGMLDGIPGWGSASPRFTLSVELGDVHALGDTPYGTRRLLALKGGEVQGDKFAGTLWNGGLDFELTRANGVREIEQITILKMSDGPAILMRSCGVVPAQGDEARMVFDFEAAADGPYAALNSGLYVGSRVLDERAATETLRIYAVDNSASTASAVSLRVETPADARAQPADCAVVAGESGDVLYSSDVGIGDGLILVGGSKRGTRNVIPITGGAMSGTLQGEVLAGGADFQLLASDGTLSLDARYTLRTADGTLVLVRNCGALGKLVPRFETSVSGPLAYLNSGTYRSDDPGVGIGSVHIVVRRVK